MGRHSKLEATRRIAVAILIVAGTIGFARHVNKHQKIVDWLFIRYAGYWLLTLFFAAACLSIGHAAVKRVLGGRVLPLFEHIAVSFASGVYIFFVAMFLGGILGRYGGVFFVVMPLALLALGARSSFRYARRAWRALAGARRRSTAPPWQTFIPHVFGVAAVALIYFAMLSPNNAAFDSRCYFPKQFTTKDLSVVSY